jgi:hypothetical protein
MSTSTTAAERRALVHPSSTTELHDLVPALPSERLHQMIQTRGLEDAGEILALATREQLRELADLDLWRSERPGQTEAFDADRFAGWLEALVDHDPAIAARQLAELDRELVVMGLAEHLRVFDEAAAASYEMLDGQFVQGWRPAGRPTAEIGGLVIVPRGERLSGAIVSVLVALEADRPDVFRDLMAGVRWLSNEGTEIDELEPVLGREDQLMHDVRNGRDERREDRGFVTADDARAFLHAARHVDVKSAPVAIVPAATPESSGALIGTTTNVNTRAIWMHERMQFLVARHPDVYAARNADLAYLANVLIAGASIYGRRFTPEEAWDAAVATCNLALEHIAPADGYLVDHDLIRVFQIGWTILHDDVVMHAADVLARALTHVRCPDDELRRDLKMLRRELTKWLRTGTPWQARGRLDAIAGLDAIAWAGLVGLIGEYPVRHAAIVAGKGTASVDPLAFELISDAAMVRQIDAFLAKLPEMLG